jgi:hypothetical protein
LQEKIINENEYKLFNSQYDNEKSALLSQLEQIKSELKKKAPSFAVENEWAIIFRRFHEEKELTREMLVSLIERIEVDANRNISITFRYKDEYRQLAEFVAMRQKGEKNE